MKYRSYITLAALLMVLQGKAQQFIDKAVVEYEVKANIKKTMPSDSWGEMLKDAMSQFKTSYYTYTFANNKSVYKFDHWDPQTKVPVWYKQNDEDNVWFTDYAAGKYNMQKKVFGTPFNMEDSLRNIEWRFSNENRMIAGFNCRKAIGKIMDSVYVFAFYTDEITVSGGPCSISGLPGLILGMTIPRMYTSWIATKVMVNGVNESAIKPVSAKKYMTYKSMSSLLNERTKEWINDDDEDSKQWRNQLLWGSLL
jgi:GLPGLI family protein